MSIDLHNLDPEELWKYNYKQTLAVVLAIEKKLFNTTVGAESIEAVINFLEYVSIITLRIEEYDFPEISKEITAKNAEAKNSRQWLQLRLNMIFLSCKSFLDNTRVVEDYNAKEVKLEAAITDLQNELVEKKKEIDNSLTEAQQKVNKKLTEAENKMQDSEHNILTHVLTLMGVFSAVITIIMSVVITATAWLNNADGASAILAFIIPSTVAVFSVVVLLFLVFLYHNATTGSDTHPIKSKTAKALFIILLVIVAALSGLLVWVATTQTQKCKPDHTHYIISSEEYTITKQENSDLDKQDLYLQFKLGEKSYSFLFDEKYVHDGNLYFCKEHQTLE